MSDHLRAALRHCAPCFAAARARFHARLLAALFWCLCALLPPAAYSAYAQHEALTPDALTDAHIDAAIEAIRSELLRRKHRQTLWEPRPWNPRSDGSPTQAGGYTALVTFALIESGMSYQDPGLEGVIDRIIAAEPTGMYTVAVRMMLFSRLPESFAPHLERETRRLLEGFSEQAVSWTYESRPTTVRRDNSLRQFGALALRDAVRRGMPVAPRFWTMLEQALVECQLPCGGWNYEANEAPPRGSMTAGSVATLYMAEEVLRRQAYVRHDPRRTMPAAPAIERGLSWLESQFTADAHPGHPGYFTYWAYGVERAALAAGRRSIGGADWFRVLGAQLSARFIAFDPVTQAATVHRRQFGAGNRALVRSDDLAFALLFLSRGRVPVAVNKLEVPDVRWNARPHDALGMSEHLSETLLQRRGWQIVHVDDAPESWLDAAMLYVASDQALPFVAARPTSGDESAAASLHPRALALRTYLDAGGLLLACSEGGSAFADSVERLGTALYPHLTWRTVTADDPILSARRRAEAAGPVRALSNGVRDLIVLVGRGDLPATFQAGETPRPSPRHTAHQALVENLYVLATEMDRPPGRLAVTAGRTPGGERASEPGEQPGSIRGEPFVIMYTSLGDQPPPEPAALPRLADRLRNTGVEIDVIEGNLQDLAHTPRNPDLLVISGTSVEAGRASGGITNEELDALRGHLERSAGLVLIETTGGRGTFAGDLERQLERALSLRARLLRDDAVITGEDLPGGASIRHCAYRPFALELTGSQPTTPRLRGLDHDGRLRIVISEDDIMHALLRRPWWGVNGYAFDDAERLIMNLLIASRGKRSP